MTVYVDDMYLYPVGRFGRMKMSHMIATSTAELLAMADRIGVQRRWLQHAGQPGEHFDIAVSKRALALEHGATAITYRQCGMMTALRRAGAEMGDPATAEARLRALKAERARAAAPG